MERGANWVRLLAEICGACHATGVIHRAEKTVKESRRLLTLLQNLLNRRLAITLQAQIAGIELTKEIQRTAQLQQICQICPVSLAAYSKSSRELVLKAFIEGRGGAG
jgi:hypothetical protein